MSTSDETRVVMTSFECMTVPKVVLILALHRLAAADVRQRSTGLLGSCLVIGWRTRTVRNISVWESLQHVYSMGRVGNHVRLTRVPARWGIVTRCAIYSAEGEWQSVMFGPEQIGRRRGHA